MASPSLPGAQTPILRQVGLPGDPDDTPQPLYRGRGRMASSSRRYICPTATRSGPRNSTISSAGWSGCRERALAILAEETAGGAWPATSTSSPKTATPSRRGRWPTTRCSSPKARPRSERSSTRAGPMRLRALHPNEERLYTFWDYTAGAWPRDAGFRIDHLLCSPQAADRLQRRGRRTNGRGARRKPPTMRRVAIELA